MFWIELLISFLALYLVYAGFSIIRRITHNLWAAHKNIRLIITPSTIISAVFIFLVGILVILMAIPLGLMLEGKIPLDPLITAFNILIALLLLQWGVTR